MTFFSNSSIKYMIFIKIDKSEIKIHRNFCFYGKLAKNKSDRIVIPNLDIYEVELMLYAFKEYDHDFCRRCLAWNDWKSIIPDIYYFLNWIVSLSQETLDICIY